MARGSDRFPNWMQLRRCIAPPLLGALLIFATPDSSKAGRPLATHGRPGWYESLGDFSRAASETVRAIRVSSRREQKPAPQENRNRYENISPEEKEQFRQKYRQWESLPPERREDLRRRMERWKELPQEDQELLRKRYEQWQQLPPQERQRIREKLDRWNDLPPEEQEGVRKRFRRP